MNIYFRKKIIYLFSLCILIGSCNKSDTSNDISVIPLKDVVGKYEIANISDYVSSISYIPLETNDNVLINTIEQIVCENGKFIIRDQNMSCMVFDGDGHYLHRLGNQGQGPQEYLFIRNISTWNDSIFLHTHSPVKIMVYHSDGQLINIIKPDSIPEIYVLYYIWVLKPQFYLSDVVAWASEYSTSTYPWSILMEEENGQMRICKEYPRVSLEKVLSGFSISNEVATMYRFNDQIRTYKRINDTIFTIGTDTEMKSAFVFDLGKYKRPIKKMFTIANQDLNYIQPSNIMESNDFLFIEFFFGNHAPERFEYLKRWPSGDEKMVTDYRVFGLFDKRTGNLKLIKQPIKGKLGFRNDIDNGPVIWPRYISSNNELVTYISVEEFMDYYDKIENPTPQMTEIAQKIAPDDNQIVIIAKLK